MISKDDKSKILNFWSEIVDCCEKERILNGEDSDLYLNPIVKLVYLRESAFCAKILATNYLVTNNVKYKEKSLKTIYKVEQKLKASMVKGLEEPFIYPKKIILKKGSIPATVISIHALTEAKKLFKGINFEKPLNLDGFIQNCYSGSGNFAHNDLSTYKKKVPAVINTSAMALYYITFLKAEKNILNSNINLIIKKILNSQRKDGLWPYCHQNIFDHLIFLNKKIIPSKLKLLYKKMNGDSSIFFGDYLHHTATIYYLICSIPYLNDHQNRKILKSLKSGFSFILNHSKNINNELKLDFSWEPKLNIIRHCNFYDTSTYFYLLASCIKGKTLFPDLSNYMPDNLMIFNYVNNKLLEKNPFKVKSHDPYNNDINLIMPRPAESIFDKAFFFSYLVDEICDR